MDERLEQLLTNERNAFVAYLDAQVAREQYENYMALFDEIPPSESIQAGDPEFDPFATNEIMEEYYEAV